MADKQYYIKINYEYGIDNGDGTYTMKNEGMANWVSMPYDNAIALENYAIIPALNLINTKAGESGLMISGIDPESIGIDLGIDTPPKKTPPGQANK